MANNWLAFGAGLTRGIGDAEEYKRQKQDKIDDEYRQHALKIDFFDETEGVKKKKADAELNAQAAQIQKLSGQSTQNNTNQATFDAMKNAQNDPDIANNNTIAPETPAPTNTPQTTVTPTTPAPQAAPVQGAPATLAPAPGQAPTAQGQPPVQNGAPTAVPQGGLNSPQGGEVPLTGAATTPPQTPDQGDSTDPLAPPTAQKDQPTPNTASTGQTYANSPTDLITDTFGNKLTREQAARATAYALQAKLPPGQEAAAYAYGLNKVREDDGALAGDSEVTGLNDKGFTIGSVPDGTVSPVVPNSFDQTRKMTPAAAGKKVMADDVSLQKDEELAGMAGKVQIELAQYLAVQKNGDSGALNKIGFIRDMGSAMNSDNATLDSINKTLTFNIVGLERAPGMRLTQAEFFIAKEAMVSRGNPPEANRNIAAFWTAKMQRPQEWADFKRSYILVNGSYNEAVATTLFNKYQQDNPIFDPELLKNPQNSKAADFKLNPNRETLPQYAARGGFNATLKALGVKNIQAPTQVQPSAPGTPTGASSPNGTATAPSASPAAVDKTGGNPISYQDYFGGGSSE